MNIDSAFVGTKLLPHQTIVAARQTTNYAAAIGERATCYFDDTRPEGVIAHPVFPVAELPIGEVGEICYHPPIVFAGYYHLPEETAKAVSREGILYTGDLGRFEDKGDYRALYLSGRRKFMIKQKGFNVFPDEVDDHIARMDGVASAEVVGIPHDLFDEGIFAFVQPTAGATVTAKAVMIHCRQIAAYKCPQHVAIWPADEPFPLTRSAKVDKLALKERAVEVVAALRRDGGWDRRE